MGAMVMTLLGLLSLLLAPVGASQEGEVCLVWLQSPITGLLLFRCPQRPDGTDGRFCCGTCLAPYCCDSEGARLDQNQYHCLHSWKMLTILVGAAVARNEKGALPVWKTLETPTPTPQPPPRPKKEIIDIVLAVIASVLIVVLIILVCSWKCPQLFAPCLGRRRGENDALPEFPMVAPSIPWRLDPPLEVYDPPPPYEERPHLPPYSQVAPSNCSHGEDEATAGSRRPALAVRGPEEAATQAPTTSGTASATGLTGAPAAAGEVTPESRAAAAGQVTPESGNALAGEVTPEPGAATGRENPPVQGAAGGGKATALWDFANRGEGASCVISSAQGEISTQPVPVLKTIHGSSTVNWETDESDV